jgi:hypothetical protein
VQGALFFAHLDERFEFLVANLFSLLQVARREPVHNPRARSLEDAADAIEERHHGFEGEDAERRQSVRCGEGEQFRDQIAKQNDDGENDRRGEPGRDARGQGSRPDENEAKDDERHVGEDVAEQEDVQDAPRVLAEDVNEFLQRRMFLLQLPELMRLEREERGFEAREERRPDDQDRDEKKENG